MGTFNDSAVNTNPVILEEFEVNPALVSNVVLGSTERQYQTSNIIVQDPSRTGILQFFPVHSDVDPEASPSAANETSMRPNRSGDGGSGDSY